MVRETLNSIREVPRIKSTAPSGGNRSSPVVSSTIAVSMVAITLLMLGGTEMVSVKSENVIQEEKSTMEPTSAPDMSHITIDLAIKRGIHSVAFSPDGSMVASDKENTVRLWDAVTGQEIKMAANFWVAFQRNWTADINSVAFSPDGRMIAGGINESEVICLWNAATGENLGFMKENSPNGFHWVNTVAFSADSKILASGSEDGNLYLWDVETGKKLKALTEATENIFSVAFSSDGRTLVSGNAGNTIRLWDIATGEKLKTLTGHTNWVFSVAFSPDGQTLASGSWDHTIRLWDATTGQQLKVLTGHTLTVWSVAFSPDGLTLASGSQDKTIRLWNVATGDHIATLTGHTAPVKSIAFSPDGVTLASGSQDGTVRLWDLTSPALLRKREEE